MKGMRFSASAVVVAWLHLSPIAVSEAVLPFVETGGRKIRTHTMTTKQILSRRLRQSRDPRMHGIVVPPRGGGGPLTEEGGLDSAAPAESTFPQASGEGEAEAEQAETSEEAGAEEDGAEEAADGADEREATASDVLAEATTLRQAGKELHDDGDWFLAAQVFSQAADLLEGSGDGDCAADARTCRLHEALCRLKMEDYEGCIGVCTALLSSEEEGVPAAIRARALHRRAKAHLGLGSDGEALQDARAAAFLGDRKAVALYGTLMRGSGGSAGAGSTGTEDLFQETTMPSMLNDLLAGKNPFLSGDGGSTTTSSALLQSLLSKSNNNIPSSSFNSPNLGLGTEMPSLLGQGGAGVSLAKSMLSSLTARLEKDSDSICEYLQKTSPAQIQALGSMAGVPVTEGQATRLANLCRGLTPRTIRRTVRYSKRAWYGMTLIRKTVRVANKHKHLLILWALLAWIQAALRRPIPVSKKAARAAAAAASFIVL